MARKKISEFRAKNLLHTSLGLHYSGIFFNSTVNSYSKFNLLDSSKTYVIKVDEGIKKRNKKGLVIINKKKEELAHEIEKLKTKGYHQFLIEEFVPHDKSEEEFLSIERVREGYKTFYSEKGGVDIEENQDNVRKIVIDYRRKNIKETQVEQIFLLKVLDTFDRYYFSFLELNPFIIHNSKFIILDSAVEVDSAGEFFVDSAWSSDDFVEGEVGQKSYEERNVEQLSIKSQASFKLNVLNPNGSIFMLLSGGGASIVIADEVANLGYGRELANYGEYSGNPNAEETYLYTKNLLSLLFKSSAKKKILLIAGGVANFTDVRVTFRGIIKALAEEKDTLAQQNVKVFVRRGGPYQEEGLGQMKEFLQKETLFGNVVGPEIVLTDIVGKALEYLK